MYSAWTSAVRRSGGRADTRDAPPPRIAPTTRPTARPPDRQTALLAIAHPPDPPAHVVADQQRTVGHHEQSHRPAPARAVAQLPAGDEIFHRGRDAALHAHPHDLRSRGH